MASIRTPNKRLFIGSLPYKFSEGELLALFIPFGKVTAVRIMRNRWGKSRGLGFVEFDNLESAIAAKTEMHNYKLTDRTIIVDYSEPDPFNTPEGQERHSQKVARFQSKHPQRLTLDDHTTPGSFTPRKKSIRHILNPAPKTIGYGTSPKKFYSPQRQSVYDSRTHHSKVGAKFAAKTKKRSTR